MSGGTWQGRLTASAELSPQEHASWEKQGQQAPRKACLLAQLWLHRAFRGAACASLAVMAPRLCLAQGAQPCPFP